MKPLIVDCGLWKSNVLEFGLFYLSLKKSQNTVCKTVEHVGVTCGSFRLQVDFPGGAISVGAAHYSHDAKGVHPHLQVQRGAGVLCRRCPIMGVLPCALTISWTY